MADEQAGQDLRSAADLFGDFLDFFLRLLFHELAGHLEAEFAQIVLEVAAHDILEQGGHIVARQVQVIG